MSDGNISLREERHINKQFYTGFDDLFYEPVHVHYVPSDELNSLVVPLVSALRPGWEIRRSGVWSHVMPASAEDSPGLPTQGWKIHVSAIEANCRDILTKVASFTLERGVQFKFANDLNTLKLMTSKRWPRGGSGKFITIYPIDDDAFKVLIESLYGLLKDDVGSYILSDQRYKDCRCLYYRYGGIIAVERLDFMGRRRPVLTGPDGEDIPDDRAPYFEVPDWLDDPFPRDEPEQEELTVNDGRYVVNSAIWFSNTGGIYHATDTRTGREVVVKEARPHVELADNGHDATTRLMQEESALRFLGDSGITPAVVDSFWDWENYYIVLERLDALNIREIMIKETPLLRVNPTVEDSAAFYGTCKRIFIGLLNVVDAIHAKGMIFGDLAPTSILVDKETMAVRLIDLESAYRPAVDAAKDIYTPGFRAEYEGRKEEGSFEDDLYAIGAIMMYCMFPIVAMAFIRKDLFTKVLPALVADIGWAATPLRHVIEQLCGRNMTCREAVAALEGEATFERPYGSRRVPTPMPLEETCAGMAAFISRHYRENRAFSLFPGDPFAGNTHTSGFGFGAAGVVHALITCGFEVPEKAMARYRADLDAIAPAAIAPGFLTGASGIAMASFQAGDIERGRRFMGYANGSPLRSAHHSLYYGMAGIGMANLVAYRATGDSSYRDEAQAIAVQLMVGASSDERGLHWADDGGVRIGYAYGQSGVALFFLRLSQALGDPSWKARGLQALEYDLSFAFELEKGISTFACAPQENRTYEHYIEQGSAGIAKVAIRYGLWDRLERILPDAHRKYSGYPGLSYGLTGFVDVLVDAYLYSGNATYLEMAERPLQGLADVYVFETAGGLAVPGENLFRISCDFATGVAGVMRTLHRRATLAYDDLLLDAMDFAGTDAPVVRTGRQPEVA